MRVLASSGQSKRAWTQLISLSVRVFWLAVFMSGAVAVSPQAEAMKFYNRSAESVFVWVTGPPPPGIHLNPTSKSKRVKSGKSWVFKPGNLRRKMDLEPSDEYTFYVWSSKAARGGGGTANARRKFRKGLDPKFHVTGNWLRTRDTYDGKQPWPRGLLMIGMGFDDDNFWLKYYGKGRTPLAWKGGCICEGKAWHRSGYGCKGRDFKGRNNRSDHPNKACESPIFWKRATYKGSYWCPKGSFFDPRKGGECWSCPNGHRRSLHAVWHAKACFKSGKTYYKKAVKHRRNSRIGQGCPRRQFWDVKGGRFGLGACYKCPTGYRRTATAVTSSKSCKKGPKTYKKATFERKKRCKDAWPGSFFDPRKGGECWTCGTGYHRTLSLSSVTSSRACQMKSGTRTNYKASTRFRVRFPPEVRTRGIDNLPPPVNPDPEPPALPAPYPKK